MSNEIRKYMDSIKKLPLKESYGNFNDVFNTIKGYIDFTLNTKTQINQYVPNTHIAKVFKEVLQACEKENMYPEIYHNVKRTPADSVKPENKHLYDYVNGIYYPKETDRISFLDIIDQYFDLEKLKANGVDEIHRIYQKLREKNDPIRNYLKLIDIRIPDEYNMNHKIKKDLKSDKITI